MKACKICGETQESAFLVCADCAERAIKNQRLVPALEKELSDFKSSYGKFNVNGKMLSISDLIQIAQEHMREHKTDGEWEHEMDPYGTTIGARCSVCGFKIQYSHQEADECPACGSKMKNGKKGIPMVNHL